MSQAKRTVDEAIVASGGCDYWTGEELRWDLLSTYSSQEYARPGASYERDVQTMDADLHPLWSQGRPGAGDCSGWRG